MVFVMKFFFDIRLLLWIGALYICRTMVDRFDDDCIASSVGGYYRSENYYVLLYARGFGGYDG